MLVVVCSAASAVGKGRRGQLLLRLGLHLVGVGFFVLARAGVYPFAALLAKLDAQFLVQSRYALLDSVMRRVVQVV